MSYEPVLDRASVVLLGKFNPAIFHPSWLARYTLIRDEEAANAKNLVVTDEVTNFEVDWLTISVTADRFVAQTDQTAYSVALRDLVLGAFGLLEHTPFWAVGINRHLHYPVESQEQWHGYGHFLAPKDPWAGLVDNPGMRAVTIWGTRADAPGARIQFLVEPSNRVRPWGIYFAFNEDRDLRREPGAEPTPKSEGQPERSPIELAGAERRRGLLDELGKGWESAQKYARSVAESLLDRGRDVRRG